MPSQLQNGSLPLPSPESSEFQKLLTFPLLLPFAIYVYLPTLTHYDLTHRGQFLKPDSQIRTSCSKKASFHFRFAMYYFFALYNNHKSFQMSIIHSNPKCSKVVGISSDIFSSVQKSLENLQKWLRRFQKSQS